MKFRANVMIPIGLICNYTVTGVRTIYRYGIFPKWVSTLFSDILKENCNNSLPAISIAYKPGVIVE
jgi:hypothetical protein